MRQNRSKYAASAAALGLAGSIGLAGWPALASGSAAAANAGANPGTRATKASAADDRRGAAASGWQEAAGKPGGSGVRVRYAVPDKIALGETVTVRLQFAGVAAADGATVEVRDAATRSTLLALRLAPGEVRTAEFAYTARSDGMQFLDVATTQAGRLTVQQVPLRVGSGELKLKAEGERRSTAAGESVITLPASSPK